MNQLSYIRKMCPMAHFLFTMLMVMYSYKGAGQDVDLMQHLKAEEQSTLEAVAMYPPHERDALLRVAEHPEILVRMEFIRRRTEENFKNRLAGLSEEDQKRIYNVSRYPELIKRILERGERLPASAMHELLHEYPEEVKEDAISVNNHYFELLKEVYVFRQNAEMAFQSMLSAYPMEIRQAAMQLAELPAIVSVLTKDINTAILLGDLYRRNAVQTNKTLDSLNIVASERQAEELNEWKKQLEDHPEALSEFETEAAEFAGMDVEDNDDVYVRAPKDHDYHLDYLHHTWRPYAYWFGWPVWYDYECWYPYPAWYHRGYYYDEHNIIVIIHLPTNFFIDWHFRHHHHLYHYPHFTDAMIRHYYGPRTFGKRVQPVLQRWAHEQRGILPENWWQDDKDRVDRIRELGKFKMDYLNTQSISRDKPITEQEFLRQHANRYPNLKPVITEPRDINADKSKTRSTVPKRNEPPSKEPVKVAREERNVEPGKPEQEKKGVPDRREQRTAPAREPSPKIDPPKKEQQKPSRSDPPSQEQPKKEPRKRNN